MTFTALDVEVVTALLVHAGTCRASRYPFVSADCECDLKGTSAAVLAGLEAIGWRSGEGRKGGPGHYAAAEELLRQAHEVVDTPRCHLAKHYAAMATAHAALGDLALKAQQAGVTQPVEAGGRSPWAEAIYKPRRAEAS